MSNAKDRHAVAVESGKRGAARRWGPRRVVRLDELDPATANVVRLLVDAAERTRSDPETAA